MLLWPDCIPCILNMALGVARTTFQEEAAVRRFLSEALSLPALRGEAWDVTSPEVAMRIWQKLVEGTGDEDPLKEVKDRQNAAALALYPRAEELVRRSEDPFLQAVKLAIAGNSVDAMLGVGRAPTEDLIEKLASFRIVEEDVRTFRQRIEGAAKVVYLTDNCGEIVFDKLLLRLLRESAPGHVNLVTRSVPTLNDATLRDARELRMDEVATVFENGIAEPLPGTVLEKLSPEVRALVDGADLVVSKGVGNHNTLTEEVGLAGRITYLFHGKCIPCCSAAGAALGELVVRNG
jgi:damage-control phosphatase, subfamily I